ncbi:uncharacterized protein [Panulirus ornatus]|uniref:uncharacterized protein n=1 Tax=Panulirus ornatus TaxID=150431 RepID=UPI003A871400
MPGPIVGLHASVEDSSTDLTSFQSCEDIQQAWGELNGNLSSESLYQDCNKQYHQVQYQRKYVNGSEHSEINNTEMLTTEIVARKTTSLEKSHAESKARRQVQETGLFCVKECLEDMDVENIDMKEAIETINVPVVEACLNVDITAALTRQKIASLQMGRTLSYADKDDTEEPPTRRSPRHVHAIESVNVRPPRRSFANREGQENDNQPSVNCRTVRVSRNPSYQSAVRDATILSPKHVAKTESSDQDVSSNECSPVRVERSIQIVMEEEKVTDSSKRHNASLGDEIDVPLATNMLRSVSFSGPEVLSPSLSANGSLSEGNSRCGSVSQLSSPSSQRSVPLLEEKAAPAIVRGSAITRSFRRLFSTPARNTNPTTPEDFWLDIPDLYPNNNSESKSSRLRKISTSFSRRLSSRPRMSGQGANTPQFFAANGTAMHEDSRNLVEYEDLLKLFCCPGCQLFMYPPLYQCRKGHLVCSTCRYSLKQVCPTCKQRFAENTNMMMEQVCQLVKFPCRWAAEGCQEYHQPRPKQDHEHFCMYRPVPCHHATKGCPKVILLRDMRQHLQECEFKNK